MSGTPGYYLSAEKNSTLAVIALVSGIVGITVFPLIGSVLALIIGRLALREIDESGGTLGGDNLAQVGLVLGWVGLALSLLGCSVALEILGCSLTAFLFRLYLDEFGQAFLLFSVF